MLLFRSALAILMVVVGFIVLVRMLAAFPTGHFLIIPGLVLGAALVALGAHRLSLIARARSMR